MNELTTILELKGFIPVKYRSFDTYGILDKNKDLLLYVDKEYKQHFVIREKTSNYFENAWNKCSWIYFDENYLMQLSENIDK